MGHVIAAKQGTPCTVPTCTVETHGGMLTADQTAIASGEKMSEKASFPLVGTSDGACAGSWHEASEDASVERVSEVCECEDG